MMLKKRLGAVLATLAMVVSGLGFVAQSAPAAEAATVIQGWCNAETLVFVKQSEILVPTLGVGGTTACKMGQGSVSAGVQAMQNALNDCHKISPGVIDANWGAQTTAAVRTFQQSKGLVVDLIYGPATHNAMRWRDYAVLSSSWTCVADVAF